MARKQFCKYFCIQNWYNVVLFPFMIFFITIIILFSDLIENFPYFVIFISRKTVSAFSAREYLY